MKIQETWRQFMKVKGKMKHNIKTKKRSLKEEIENHMTAKDFEYILALMGDLVFKDKIHNLSKLIDSFKTKHSSTFLFLVKRYGEKETSAFVKEAAMRAIEEELGDDSIFVKEISNKTKKHSLKEAMLSEQVVEQPPQSSADFTPPNSKPISLDQIIDRYIVRYERESIPLEGQGLPQAIDEAADIKKLVAFLLEQAPPPPPDEEEPDPNDPATADPAAAPAPDAAAEAPPDPAGGLGDMGGGGDMGDMGGDEPAPDAGGGGEGPPSGSPPVMNTPALSMPNFCRAMARLLNNFDTLLNPKTIILARASAYIASNYDARTAKYFEQVMKNNYGIHGTSVEYPDDSAENPEHYSGLPGSGGGQG